ncbi:Pvc16 family protein [Streptomyces aurantiogriseus]
MSYLITAWTRRPEDEHRLLSSLLLCLLRSDAMPTEHLTGSLAELPLPVPMTIALPPPEDRSFADVWSALGGELKPSLDLVVSVPLVGTGSVPAAPPVTEEGGLRLGLENTGRTGQGPTDAREADAADEPAPRRTRPALSRRVRE